MLRFVASIVASIASVSALATGGFECQSGARAVNGISEFRIGACVPHSFGGLCNDPSVSYKVESNKVDVVVPRDQAAMFWMRDGELRLQLVDSEWMNEFVVIKAKGRDGELRGTAELRLPGNDSMVKIPVTCFVD